MTQLPPLHHFNLFRRAICVCGTLSLLLLPGHASWADDDFSNSAERLSRDVQGITDGYRVYTPPPDSRISGEDHTGGGVRGCGEEIVALAPRLSGMGKTVSTRPTFVWYVLGDDVAQLEFHLYRHQSGDELEEIVIDSSVGPSQAGYMTYTLPSEVSELSTGDTYLWQVVAYCDQNREEVGTWTSADIEIVEFPVNLAATLPENSLQRAKVYARSGFWYDAMAEGYAATLPGARDFRRNLLLDLADLDDQSSNSTLEIDLSDQVRRIAEMQ